MPTIGNGNINGSLSNTAYLQALNKTSSLSLSHGTGSTNLQNIDLSTLCNGFGSVTTDSFTAASWLNCTPSNAQASTNAQILATGNTSNKLNSFNTSVAVPSASWAMTNQGLKASTFDNGSQSVFNLSASTQAG